MNKKYFLICVPRLLTKKQKVWRREIYSCNLIRNDITDKNGKPFRWRGRYNEDTILSLDILADGNCPIQYNAFTTGKLVTQAVAGGNTAEFYEKEGTKPKSQMLADQFPDIAECKWMNDRWHHYVDYSGFKNTRLIAEKDFYVNSDPEYGMTLKTVQLKEKDLDSE